MDLAEGAGEDRLVLGRGLIAMTLKNGTCSLS